MEDENHDVFSEEDKATTVTDENEGADNDEAEGSPKAEEQGAEATTQQGDDDAETPAADGDNGTASEKMIPESRFKAALKDVNRRLEEATQRLSQYEQPNVPDRHTDPEGFERHTRIQVSKDLMQEAFPDYREKIEHFNEMAKTNPELWDIVGRHKLPAKLAYDLATKDLKFKELDGLKDSEEFKEFQEWKRNKNASATKSGTAVGKQLAATGQPKVPNLNKTATALNPNKVSRSEQDDELWSGHHNRK